MNILVPNKIIGTKDKSSLIITVQKVELIKNINDYNIDLIFGTKDYRDFCTLNLIKEEEIPTFPPRKFLNAFLELVRDQELPSIVWELFMPQNVYKAALMSFGKAIQETLNDEALRYQRDTTKHLYKDLFASLTDTYINKDFYFSLEEITQESILKSFAPNISGYVNPPKYTTLKAITGRPSIEHGPNITLLKKEYRKNIMTSFFGKKHGTIFMADFQAIEPRTLKYIYSGLQNNLSLPPKHFGISYAGQPSNQNSNPYAFGISYATTQPSNFQRMTDDIYRSIFPDNNIDRNLIKEIVLSELYGQEFETFIEKYKNRFTRDYLNSMMEQIKHYFGIDHVKNLLINEARETQKYIRNYFGRKISIEQARTYMYLNYYIQSTSADIALMGFSKLIKNITNIDYIRPLSILIDAMFFDVHNKFVDEFEEAVRKAEYIDEFNNSYFPIKIERITNGRNVTNGDS